MKKELWRKIIYKNVKRNMYSISSYGNVFNNFTKKNLHPWKGKNGYLYVSLMCDDNKPVKIGVHVLVATHFVKVPKCLRNIDEPIVPNHNDFNKENNYYENLQWMTYSMNNEWNIIHGHCKFGEDSPSSKVSNEIVHMICKLMEDGYSNKNIMQILKFDKNEYFKSLLTSIRTGKNWKQISEKYNITNKNTLRRNDPEFVDNICKLIEKGYSVKEMREKLGIQNDKTEKEKFKKLVWFIRTRKCYKDISSKYTW